MNAAFLTVAGIAAGIVVVMLLRDIFLIVWKQGYDRGYDQGRRDAADWWTQAAKDVEEMKQEIGREEQ